MADKSTVANVLDAQVKDDFFGDVVKRIILNNVMNRLHDGEIETFSILASEPALAGQKTWILPTENDNRLSISVKSRPLLKNHHFVGLNT